MYCSSVVDPSICVVVLVARDRQERDGILPDVLRMIGNTPLIRLDKIARSEGLKCNLCELVELNCIV